MAVLDINGLTGSKRQEYLTLANLIERLYDLEASSNDRMEAYDLLTVLEFYGGFPPTMDRRRRASRLAAVMARLGVGRFKTHSDRPRCYVGIKAK